MDSILQTTTLFAKPSLSSGLARLLDLFGVFDSYNSSSTPEEADRKAMYADWRIVGQDIAEASKQYELEEEEARRSSEDKQLPLFAGR